ncbi:MAG: septum formation initiator family protein [Actinobacteria bacterium]|nr:septum formation initiator family protein [Actinomycetota bacterium]MBV9254118.1 septum formation initiator family protein [Actinomycetota bacterium]
MATVVVGMLFLAVFPARTYLRQRHSLSAAKARLHVLAQQNTALDKQVKKLHTDSEIERLARQQYNLVRPGEEAYAILPGPEAAHTHTVKATPPKKHKGFWSRAWDDVSFWN